MKFDLLKLKIIPAFFYKRVNKKKFKKKMEAELYSDTKPLKKLLLDNHKCEIMNKASNENEEKSANNEALIINKKPNKPMTPYIAFVKEFKENHGGASFKELGRIWNEITSVEEKQKYVKIAEEDMNRYRKEMAAYVFRII